MSCKTCSIDNVASKLVCPDCKTINASYIFSDNSVRVDYKKKKEKLEFIINKKIDTSEYQWDSSVAKYATKIERARNILELEGIKTLATEKLKSDLENFLQRSKNAEFHIALVGTIKAGKSTLINALLGSDLASTRVTPETASLTKFKKSIIREDYVKVSFYTGTEWDDLWKSVVESNAKVFMEEYVTLNADRIKEEWLNHEAIVYKCSSMEELKNEIQKWTSSKAATHYFVKEVEVGIADLDLPQGVVLVDTPGLDDVVAYRSEITRDYINRANAVLVCVKSDALTSPEMKTIYAVFANTRYNPEKVFIIATQLDTLNHPEKDWEEQRREWLKYLVDEGAYGNIDLAKNNLVPVSGYLYSLINTRAEISTNSDAFYDLSSTLFKFRIHLSDIEMHIDKLMKITGIDALKQKLESEIIDNHKELLIRDIQEGYAICAEELLNFADKVERDQLEIIELAEKGIDEIKARQEKQEEEIKRLTSEKIKLQETLDEIKSNAQLEGRKLAEKIRGMGKKA